MAQIFFTKSNRRPSSFATLGLAVIFLSAATLLGAGPILGFFQQTSSIPDDIYNWRLRLLELVNLLLLCGSTLTIIGILHGRFSSRVRISWRGFVSVLMAMCVAGPLWLLEQAKKNAPNLHDITTNISDPPYFQYLEERSYSTNQHGNIKGGRLDPNYTSIHQKHFGTLKPLQLDASPSVTITSALQIAKRLGWTIENKHNQLNQIEATSIDPFLQLRSNIVLRVRPVDAGKRSILDIRAVSLLGVSDYGMNARLINKFLAEIRAEFP